jgi:hypothetical protein
VERSLRDVGSLAVFYGRSAAGDLFPPLVMDDYLLISMDSFRCCRAIRSFAPRVRAIDERMAGTETDINAIRNEVKEHLELWAGQQPASSVK